MIFFTNLATQALLIDDDSAKWAQNDISTREEGIICCVEMWVIPTDRSSIEQLFIMIEQIGVVMIIAPLLKYNHD
jgi:hypothetical protein